MSANDSPPAPRVSVLTTVYNRATYLPDCVRSVQQQSFADWELILVDDASQDESVALARALEAEDRRIRVYVNERNLGDYPNRNRAAALARGQYLKYLDADDVLYSHGLQVMVDALDRFPEAGLALSQNVIDDALPYPFPLTPSEVYRAHFLGRGVLGVGPSAAIVRRDNFERLGGFSGRQFVGDTELWLRLAAMASVVVLPPALVWWRRHAGQQMALERQEPGVLTSRFRMAMEALDACGALLRADECARARERLRNRQARAVWRLALSERRLRQSIALARDSGLGWRDVLRGLGPGAGR